MSGKLGMKRTTEEEFKNIQSLKQMGVKNKQIADIFKRSEHYISIIPATGKTFAEFKAERAAVKKASYERIKAAKATQPTLAGIKIDVPKVELPEMPAPKRTVFGAKQNYYDGYDAGERAGQLLMLRAVASFVQEQIKLLEKEYGKKA